MNFMTDWAAMVAGILELFYSDVNMSPLFLALALIVRGNPGDLSGIRDRLRKGF